MEGVVVTKSEPASDTEDGMPNGINAGVPSLVNETTSQRNESTREPHKNSRLTKQPTYQQNRMFERNANASNTVSAFHEDSEFPLLLNRSKTTTYSRRKVEIRPEDTAAGQGTEKSATSSGLPPVTNVPEARPPYFRIRVSTNLFYPPPAAPSSAAANEPAPVAAAAAANISLDLSDAGASSAVPAVQHYELADLVQPGPPSWSIAYSNAERETVDATYLVRHVPPKRNKGGSKYHLPKVVVCDICDLDFIGPHDLKAHLSVVHRPWALAFLKDVYCGHCRAWFDDEFQYKGHTPCYRSAVRQFCPICCMERPLLEHFALHHVLVRPGKKYSCRLCKSPARHSLLELNEHRQRVHQQHGVFECLECGEAFARAQDVRRHVLRHLDNDAERNHAKALAYKLKIKGHEDRVYKCAVCARQFLRKRLCILHQRTHDRSLCSVCGLSFRNNCLLVEHQNVHFKSESFDCSVCGKSFTFRKNLVQHTRIHRLEKNYDCQFCELSFAQQTSLIYHMATHTNENIFRCSVCDIRFDKQSKLTSHMQIHNADGSNPHQCKLCNKYFAHNCNLLVHMRVHPEWKPAEAVKVHKAKAARPDKENQKKAKTKEQVAPRRSKRINRDMERGK